MTNGSSSIAGGMPGSPGFRPCCLLAEDAGPFDNFVDPTGSLNHKYGAGYSEYVLRIEISGLAYTCSLGFVDLGHIRDCIDLTRYYYEWIRRRRSAGDKFPTYHYGGEILIRRDIPSDEQVEVAASLAYDHALFHEIYSYWSDSIGSHNSSFSPEDLPSNLVGTYVGRKAIAGAAAGNHGGDFNRNATAELRSLLTAIVTVSKPAALRAFASVSGPGRWVDPGVSDPNEYLRRRNFEYHPVQPWVLTTVPECTVTTLPADLALSFPREIRESYEAAWAIPSDPPSIRSAMGGATQLRNTDFDIEINRIKTTARATYGADFDKP
jgi:hypothetical protein